MYNSSPNTLLRQKTQARISRSKLSDTQANLDRRTVMSASGNVATPSSPASMYQCTDEWVLAASIELSATRHTDSGMPYKPHRLGVLVHAYMRSVAFLHPDRPDAALHCAARQKPIVARMGLSEWRTKAC